MGANNRYTPPEINTTFGRLTYLGEVPDLRPRHGFFRCECGTEVKKRMAIIVNGQIRSCGCLLKEYQAAGTVRTHGLSHSPTNRSYAGMLQRCTNPKAPNYGRYGGRGIEVCWRWRESFENFLADMGKRPKGKTLDRIDNNGNYEPSNCRWATPRQQQRNTSYTRLLTHNGITKPLQEWADDLGINKGSLWNRIERGWTVEEALTRPRRNYPR